jgi:esterase/lipase superfamily enzyme
MLTRRKTVAVLAALLAALIAMIPAFAQIEQTLQESKPVAAFASARSESFALQPGEIVRVTGRTSGAAGFLIESYVYRETGADKPELVAADDPEVVSAAFEWTVNEAGSYYVLVRNVSAVEGTYQVIVVRGAKAGNAKVDAPLATVRIFYATNRQPAADGRTSPYYTGDPAPDGQLAVGTCQVTIPRDHHMGEIEGPSIFKLEFSRDPEKHVVLKTVSPEANRQKFFAEVSAQASTSAEGEAFVFIHGFNVSFEDAAMRTAQMSYDLGFAGAPIFYSWPSEGKASLLAYTRDGRNADVSAAHLKSFLEQLTANTGVRTVHLIAHSMGNRVLTQALDQLASAGKTAAKAHFRQVALLAPDVDADLFRQVAKRIQVTADRVTLYASSRDEALKLSQKLAGYPRAGAVAPYPVIVAGMDTIDASSVDTSMLGVYHQYYADNQTVLSDLFQLLRGAPAATRFGLTATKIAAGSYWSFRPAAR